MGSLAAVYDNARIEMSDLLKSLSDEELDRSVPATPDWTIRNIASHLAADATCLIAGDFPSAFFESFASPEGIRQLNAWTERQIADRTDKPLEDVLEEWEKSAITVTAMMRGEQEWPGQVPFADRILITDVTVHHHDVIGALGRQGDRESAGVKLGSAGYVAMVGFRLAESGAGCIGFDAGDKKWVVGGEVPDATVRTSRFELFRALSGRRSPEQIRAYDWTGDPEPFIEYFYPYGIRETSLIE